MTVEVQPNIVNPLLGYVTAIALVSGGLAGISGTGANMVLPGADHAEIGDAWSNLEFQPLIISNSVTGTSASVSQISHSRLAPTSAPNEPLSSAELVKQVHSDSGLTWEQLAKVFGVSRRALHQWASGSRLNSANLEKLSSISGLLGELRLDSPEERRSALFAPDGSGVTLYDKLRAARATSAITVSEPLWNPDSLAGGKTSATS